MNGKSVDLLHAPTADWLRATIDHRREIPGSYLRPSEVKIPRMPCRSRCRSFGLAGVLVACACGPSVETMRDADAHGTSSGGGETGGSTLVEDSADVTSGDTGASDGESDMEPDAELEAVAALRSTLDDATECLDLRKAGYADSEPGIVVFVDIPPANMAEPGEELATRTYTLPEDAAHLQLRAFVVHDPESHACEDVPTDGSVFDGIAGTFEVEYEVVDQGCLFTCERLFVAISDLVVQRQSDGATVEVGTLYVPSWSDPNPPE